MWSVDRVASGAEGQQAETATAEQYCRYQILPIMHFYFSDLKFVFQTSSQNCAEGGSGRRLGSGTLRKNDIIDYCPTCSETILIGSVPGVSVHVPNASCVKCPTTHNLFSNTLYHLH